MKILLQTVCHTTTEHCWILNRSKDGKVVIEFAIATDKPTDLWDAPYRPWVKFTFDDLFGKE